MKIAFLHRDLPPRAFAGVAVQVHRLANALTTAGHAVTVYSESPRPDEGLYQTVRIAFPGLVPLSRFLPGLKRVWFPLGCRSLDFPGFDVVHIHGDGGFLRYAPNHVRTFYGSARFEAEHSVSLRGKFAQRFSFALEQREMRHCRHAVAIGPHVGQYLPAVKTVIPCMTAHPPDPTALNQKSAHPSLLYLGSKGGRKRGELVLPLLHDLRAHFPDLELDYVGPESEKREWDDVPGLRFHSRLSESDLNRLFARSWIYVCLSSYEGFGVPWAEAQSNGCAVVTTPHWGAREWLRDGENAIIRDPVGMAAAIHSLCGNPDGRRALVERGFATAKAFAPERVAERYLAVYREAVAAP